MRPVFIATVAALCLFALASLDARAQANPFLIEVIDSAGVTTPHGLKEFYVYITNNSGTDQRLYVTRTSNLLPNGSWVSFICSESACYAPDDNSVAAMLLSPEQKTYIKLTVVGGPTPNETGVVTLEFSSGPFTEGVEQHFTLTVATSSIASGHLPVTRVAAIPNPASGSTLLPGRIRTANGMSVRLFDPLGRLVADLSSSAQLRNDGVQIDLNGLAEGTYFYQLDADGYRGSGTLVVSR